MLASTRELAASPGQLPIIDRLSRPKLSPPTLPPALPPPCFQGSRAPPTPRWTPLSLLSFPGLSLFALPCPPSSFSFSSTLPFLPTLPSQPSPICFPPFSLYVQSCAPAAIASFLFPAKRQAGGAAGGLRAGALRSGGAGRWVSAQARAARASLRRWRPGFGGSLSQGWGPRGGGTMFLHSVNLWNLAFYSFMVFMATLGLWDVFFGFEENKCSMSYMFEYPEYQVSCRPLLTWAPGDWGPSGLALLWVSPAVAPRASAIPGSQPHLCFSVPGDSAEPHGPPHLPFVSFLRRGAFPGWFPEHSARRARSGSAASPPSPRPQTPRPGSPDWPPCAPLLPQRRSLSPSPEPRGPCVAPLTGARGPSPARPGSSVVAPAFPERARASAAWASAP